MHGFPTGHKSVGSPASDEGIVIYGIVHAWEFQMQSRY
jgi:hypothetical protein